MLFGSRVSKGLVCTCSNGQGSSDPATNTARNNGQHYYRDGLDIGRRSRTIFQWRADRGAKVARGIRKAKEKFV